MNPLNVSLDNGLRRLVNTKTRSLYTAGTHYIGSCVVPETVWAVYVREISLVLAGFTRRIVQSVA